MSLGPGLVRGLGGHIWRYSPLLMLAAFWEALPRLQVVPHNLLPSFLEVVSSWYWLLTSGDLAVHIGVSLGRSLAGFAMSCLLGTALGILMARSEKVRAFFEPLVTVTYPIPKPVLIPLFIIWLGIGHISKIAVIFAGCIIPIIISSFNGARGIDPYLVWSARSMGSSERNLFVKVLVPYALPDILSGMRMALAISFILLVSSEMLAGQSGMGFLIFSLGESGQYSSMFAVVLTITFLGFTADRLFLVFTRKVTFWRQE